MGPDGDGTDPIVESGDGLGTAQACDRRRSACDGHGTGLGGGARVTDAGPAGTCWEPSEVGQGLLELVAGGVPGTTVMGPCGDGAACCDAACATHLRERDGAVIAASPHSFALQRVQRVPHCELPV